MLLVPPGDVASAPDAATAAAICEMTLLAAAAVVVLLEAAVGSICVKVRTALSSVGVLPGEISMSSGCWSAVSTSKQSSPGKRCAVVAWSKQNPMQQYL